MSFFEVSGLCAGYGRKRILNDISFKMDAGMVAGLLGENGSGKTTLINSICGILHHEGECTLDGAMLKNMRAKQIGRLCGYVPQSSGVSVDLSLREVVLMGCNAYLRLLEEPDDAMQKAADAALFRVGLEDMMDDGYLQVSEGQKRLCLLARAMVMPHKLFLMDEPESALDLQHRWKCMSLLRETVSDGQSAALVSLHDPQLALDYCDMILLLKNGAVADILYPHESEAATLERGLAKLYGPVSVHGIRSGNGDSHLVVVKEGKDGSAYKDYHV